MNIISKIDERQINRNLPSFKTGDYINLHYKITEENKTRIQVFKGVCIQKKRPNTLQCSFILRKRSFGVGVEKTFLLHSPLIKKIEIVSHGKVRRARLFYLRDLKGKKERLKKVYFTNKKN